jgi:hypothetical protein
MQIEHLVERRELTKGFILACNVGRLNGIGHCKIIG